MSLFSPIHRAHLIKLDNPTKTINFAAIINATNQGKKK